MPEQVVASSSTTVPSLYDAAWDSNGMLQFVDSAGDIHEWQRVGPSTSPHTVYLSINGESVGEFHLTWSGGTVATVTHVDPISSGEAELTEDSTGLGEVTWDDDGWSCDPEVEPELCDDDPQQFTFLYAEGGNCEYEMEEAREKVGEAAVVTAAVTPFFLVGVVGTIVSVGAGNSVGAAVGGALTVGSSLAITVAWARAWWQVMDAHTTCMLAPE